MSDTRPQSGACLHRNVDTRTHYGREVGVCLDCDGFGFPVLPDGSVDTTRLDLAIWPPHVSVVVAAAEFVKYANACQHDYDREDRDCPRCDAFYALKRALGHLPPPDAPAIGFTHAR